MRAFFFAPSLHSYLSQPPRPRVNSITAQTFHFLSLYGYFTRMSESEFTEKQHAAMKDILLGWGDLSLGDISVICCVWRTPGPIETIADTPHSRFWMNMVHIGWAERLYSVLDPGDLPFEPAAFRLTDEGHAYLPRFLLFYELLNKGACAPAQFREKLPEQESEIAQEGRPDPWLPKPKRLLPALVVIAAGMWLLFRGANPFLCFFLLTYSSVVVLFMHADIFEGEFGKALRGLAGVNVLFLCFTVIPLLFH